MKKAIKIVVSVVAIVLIVVVISLLFFVNSIVKTSVETVVPKITKTDVKLEKVHISPFTGRGEITGLVIGNPEGFETPSAISLGQFKIDIRMRSLLSDVIVIDEILIKEPEITYELGLGKSNIGKLMANLQPPDEEKPEEDKPKKEKAEGGKKVQINDLRIEGGKVRLSAKLLQGVAAPIPLPPIHLKDLGKESDGITVAQTVTEILSAIMNGVAGAVAGSGKLLGDGAKLLGNVGLKGAGEAGEAAVAAADAAVKGLGAAAKGVGAAGSVAADGAKALGGATADGAKAVGGAAVDSAKAVGDIAGQSADAAVDAAKSVGGAAVKGVSSIFGGVKGILGGGKEEPKAVTNGETKVEAPEDK